MRANHQVMMCCRSVSHSILNPSNHRADSHVVGCYPFFSYHDTIPSVHCSLLLQRIAEDNSPRRQFFDLRSVYESPIRSVFAAIQFALKPNEDEWPTSIAVELSGNISYSLRFSIDEHSHLDVSIRMVKKRASELHGSRGNTNRQCIHLSISTNFGDHRNPTC